MYFFVVYFFRLFYLFFLNKFSLYNYLTQVTLSFYIFLLALALTSIYALLHLFTSFSYFNFSNSIVFYDFFCYDFFIGNCALRLNLCDVYYFPFIYIFLLITVLAILFCLSYSLNELIVFSAYCGVILCAGSLIFFTDSLIFFFFAYEMLLIPSFFILYRFAKTRRCVEAAYLMFFWTQFGALFLIFSFLYLFFLCQTQSFTLISTFAFAPFDVNVLFLCWLVGFGVKLPIWPFYGWLPKAHVEASTNFSIFLSGVLVKFAFFGLLKCLVTVQIEPTFYCAYPFLVVGITDAVFKLFYQVDLKKLVAYSTVVEMHWLTMCVISGQSPLMLASFCMLISHALLSANSFLLVDAISRRFKTRLITEISGVNLLCPNLFLLSLVNCLIFLGFPGSIFFVSEFLFFSFFFDLFPVMSFYLLLLLYLLGPTFFFRTWFNALFGASVGVFKRIPLDLSAKELLIHGGLSFLMFWLGASWQIFIF